MKTPIVALVGQTASGKTDLAIELARQFNGEIICADSRTIYREMDIVTAKPTPDQQKEVPHHMLDVVYPRQRYTAADFARGAHQVITDIHRRGKLPFLVGGSGLYVDAVIYGFDFMVQDEDKQKALSDKTVEELQMLVEQKDLTLPENRQNKRHLISTLLREGQVPSRSSKYNALVIGLSWSKEQIDARIRDRAAQLFDHGLIEEVAGLFERYGRDLEEFNTPGFRAALDFIDGKASKNQAIEQFAASDIQLAKKQRTWFRRSEDIFWTTDKSKIVERITTFLNTQ